MTQTILIVVVTAVISIMGFSNRRLINELIMDPILIKSGQYYRLLTSGFVHSDYMHLIFNMFTLYSFGQYTELSFFNHYGKFTFTIVYLVGIIVSSIPSYIKNRNNTRYLALGASGGVSAILFSSILLNPWATLGIFFIPCPAIIFGVLYLGYSWYMNKKGTDNIGHEAHFYGAIFGLAITIIIEPSVFPYFIEALQHPHFNF